MATTGAVGGSQIDVLGLVSQLVAADRAPAETQITRDTTRVTTQISALGTLMGSMSSFRSALSSLNSVDVFSTRTASSSDTDIFKVSASAKAVPGSYQVEVEQLAKAHQISSTPFEGGSSSVVGTGKLTLALGGKSFSVEIGNSNSTLAGVRDAINGAADNTGIRATLVSGTGGSRLVLSSSTTGEANKIVVSQSGGDGGLSKLAYSASQTGNYTQLAAAQDALVNIAGAQTKSASNVIAGAIDGVTINLATISEEDKPVTLTVGYDQASVTTRINNFVTAYNALQSQISKLRSYDATSKVAGPMLGDSLLGSIESQLRRTISTPVSGISGAGQTLAGIGITTQANGNLAVDSAKLQNALSSNFEAVGKLFGSENGVGKQLFAQVDERLKSGGALDNRSKNLVTQQKSIAKRTDDLNVRMETLRQGYTKQFTALDTLLSKLQVTSAYMSQQIESMANNK